jgi:hypothetical protein
MRHRRLWIAPVGILVLVLAVVVGQVSAAESRQGDECVLAADETVASDLYVACNTLTIEGVVEGDLIGGAWSASIAPGGRVTGDVWLVGGQLRVDGAVGDDLHFAGVDLDLTGSMELQPGADVAAVALNVEVWEGATVPGDLLTLSYQTIVRGDVGQDVHFNGSALVVEGEVAGDVWARVGGGETSPSFIPFPFPFSVSFQTPGLTVGETARVGGDLSYAGPSEGNINGHIGGIIDFARVQPHPDITQTETQESGPGDVIVRYLNAVAADVLSLMAAGILMVLIAPAWVREPAALVVRHVPSSFGWGLILTLLAAPVGLILLLVSVLLLVLLAAITLGGFTWMGLLLLTIVNAVVIGGLSFVILFLARLVICDLIGRRLGRRIIHPDDRPLTGLLALLIGAVIYALLTNVPLPWVGQVINAVGIFIGLGAIALHARQLYQRMTRPAPYATPPAPLHPRRLEALLGNQPAPPPDSTDLPGPGLTNLPTGFEWWVEDDEKR